MATVTVKPIPVTTTDAVSLDRVFEIPILAGGLDHYLAMVNADGFRPRIKCYDGSLLLVSPGIPHERTAERLGHLVMTICGILKIPCSAYASTLFRLPGQDKGIEPDKSYYLDHLDAIRDKTEIDLNVDPPPDLIIEIVDTHTAKKPLAFGREVGIPEIWVYEVRKRGLEIFILKHRGKAAAHYQSSKKSRAFPFLNLDDITAWVGRNDLDDSEFYREAHEWVRTELAPRLLAPKSPKKHD